MPGSAPPPSPARQDPALPAETAAAQRRRPGAVTGTGTARHCPSGTTGVFDGPDGPWCLPPACLLPPGPGASPGAAADRGRYRRSQPGGLMPAGAIGLGLRQRPGIPRRVSWVTHHCCTRPSPSLMTSRQACRSWCQPACPASITPPAVRCHRTNHPIPAPATQKRHAPFPAAAPHIAPRARSPPAGPGAEHRQESPRSCGDRSPRRRRGSR